MPNSDKQAIPAIEIRGVSFAYPGSEISVLQEASLTLKRGTFAAIAGGNGSGKSTLCKLFNGLIPNYYSGDFEGTVHVCGVPAEGHTVAQLSRMVGYVYQDFENQLVRPTVFDEACFAPLNYGLPDYRLMASKALDLCGLSDLRDRYVWELSGGQKHLLALAGALSLEPEVLIVDEPVAQLDPQHARQVYEVLRRLNRDHGKTVIVIEHHADFIAEYCHEVCLMESGRVLWQRPTAEALNSLDDLDRLGIQPPEVTRAAAVLRKIESARTQSDPCSSLPDRHFAGRHAAERLPITMDEAVAHFTAFMQSGSGNLHPSPVQIPASDQGRAGLSGSSSNEVIRLQDASLHYRALRRAQHQVLHALNLTLFEGERIALVGNNGAGKSSLLKLVAGVARPQSGSVTVLGQDTRSVSLEQLSSQVTLVFQNPEDMFIEDSVEAEVSHCLRRRAYPNIEVSVTNMLRAFRLEELRQRDARLLSGGQQRRVSLAIGAAIRPEIMLLDEPTANLDLSTREELLGALEELSEHVRTVVIATHDMQLVSRWATRVVVMHQGEVVGDGTPDDIFADRELTRRAGIAPTQTAQLSADLGIRPLCRTPEELATRIAERMWGSPNECADRPSGNLTHKEAEEHAARSQLV